MNGIQESQKLEFAQNVNLRIGTKKELTQARLKELLEYEPDTGYFIWKDNVGYSHIRVGIAGSLEQNGYLAIGVDGQRYQAHNLVWLYQYGVFPEKEIDHINRIRDDNRFKNLRELSCLLNNHNLGLSTRNTSGVTGVGWHKAEQKWQASITNKKRVWNLGLFKEKLDAVKARWEGEKRFGWNLVNPESSAYWYLSDRGLL